MESLLVLPLICADEAIGSFAVAAKRPRAFGKDKREMLTVIANHVARLAVERAACTAAWRRWPPPTASPAWSTTAPSRSASPTMLARAERYRRQARDPPHRHRPLQEGQRHLRPPHRRRGAARRGAVVRDCVRKMDIGGPLRRRRVRHRPRGHRPRRRPPARRAHPRRGAEAESSSRRRARSSCTLSLGIAVYPDDGREARRSSITPTSRSITPSTTAATAPSPGRLDSVKLKAVK